MQRPELAQPVAATDSLSEAGQEVGKIARQLYDLDGTGVLIDIEAQGVRGAIARTKDYLARKTPMFEAGLSTRDIVTFADILLPVRSRRQVSWRMVEVKSSTGVKAHHRDDAAIQSYVARSAGVDLAAIAIAYIDSAWVYPGSGDYAGLFVEEDMTREARDRESEVKAWIEAARNIVALSDEPQRQTGAHCASPFTCPFLAHCQNGEAQAQYPVQWLPRLQKKETKSFIETKSITDMRDVPNELLNELQLRVKKHTLSNKPFFNRTALAAELAAHKRPAYFLDFETVNFAVPIWKGTRPYQQIPFQFSLHVMSRAGKIEHRSFLDLSGDDPSFAFANALLQSCGEAGPVFVYNAGFESARIKELAARFVRLRRPLSGILDRLVDLLPMAQEHFYHPSQQGRWSVKRVLPAIAPDLDYGDLDGVQNGVAAMDAYREAINDQTSVTRREEIRRQLSEYCKLDTLALVRIWQEFSGARALGKSRRTIALP